MLNKSLASLQSIGLPGGCAFGSCFPVKKLSSLKQLHRLGFGGASPLEGRQILFLSKS